jgi:hypothetical protein
VTFRELSKVSYARLRKKRKTKFPQLQTFFSLSRHPHRSFRSAETRTRKKHAHLSKTGVFARRLKVEKGEREREVRGDSNLNRISFLPRSKTKKNQKIPCTRVPFVTRPVLPTENFQARLVVFPRRRSRGRAGGNHRLFLFQNWVRHDKKNENFGFLLNLPFFSLLSSSQKVSLGDREILSTAGKRVTENVAASTPKN